MKHILPTDTVNKVLGYLATKAFSEVHALITEIQTSAVQLFEPEKESAPSAPAAPATSVES